MKAKEEQKIKISFPISQYFQQLFGPDFYVKFINPFSFWRRYRIDHLESCWEIDIVRYLERCYQIEEPATKSQPDNRPKNFTETGKYRGLPWEKTPQNMILISQPSFELKYRGVTYRTSSIVAIDADKIEIKPDLLILDSSKKLATSSNNSNISQTSSNISQPKQTSN